mmetsp:Transcript_86934/g.153953  ORF Transcript_86934/g.153953 Transcript_86934/m.153953 type:complete len:131 (-) Transcript_86934:260-652(-)
MPRGACTSSDALASSSTGIPPAGWLTAAADAAPPGQDGGGRRPSPRPAWHTYKPRETLATGLDAPRGSCTQYVTSKAKHSPRLVHTGHLRDPDATPLSLGASAEVDVLDPAARLAVADKWLWDWIALGLH